VSAFLAHNATATMMYQLVWPNGAAFVVDIFVSYTSSDCDWAFWIAKDWEATISKSAYCH